MIFKIRKDGGQDSNVTGYWLIEWKKWFSVVLLRFDDGSREAYHSHAFNAVSWVIRGELEEHRRVTRYGALGFLKYNRIAKTTFKPSLIPVVTTRGNMHKVYSKGTTWVLSFRGPWRDKWQEFVNGETVTLTHGRQITDV